MYLDSNDNGRRDAGEAGAPNVVVVLNGRFQAHTNGDGRFEFPSVTIGDHFLTVVPDNLPLAWSFPPGARADVHVRVHTETRVELGAGRLR
ncbi:MAG: carboxypeptidase-like regulatory domain-containing protein [Steroidobacteraceae bacterium]|nr:carboxypeptidase-like regulatory domain-containing protein [Steroidobacteraceae bacterium]